MLGIRILAIGTFSCLGGHIPGNARYEILGLIHCAVDGIINGQSCDGIAAAENHGQKHGGDDPPEHKNQQENGDNKRQFQIYLAVPADLQGGGAVPAEKAADAVQQAREKL